ncbi:2485_t:CDS:2, partial [Scutellospora calospora]
FWENTKEPTLKKFLDFRLRSGDLEDMQTEHNNYKNELLTISSYYAKISEIGEKYWERLLVCWCAHLPMVCRAYSLMDLLCDLLVRKGKKLLVGPEWSSWTTFRSAYGIIEVSLNATDLEIGLMEVVGSAIEIDFKKLGEDTEKVFKAMQISMFYQRLYFLQRGATEDKIKCIESYGIVVYQRVITIYTMHRIPEGIYIVDILMQFSIPEIKNDFYMIKELIEKIYFFKIRIMEYYTKMRAIIQNPSRTYIQTKELPTEASPSKTSKKIFEI